jgi:hypothetical protein
MSEGLGTTEMASLNDCHADGYQVLPIAYCQVPIAACHIANPCTVTAYGTSVTNLPLAHSVLIDVGKLALERGPEKRVWPTFRLAAGVPHCSFQGGTCIQ